MQPRRPPVIRQSAISVRWERLDAFAIVTPGLEALARAEARAAGIDAEVAETGGGIVWTGDVRSVVRSNLALRIPSRVLVRLASFPARSFAELERHARQVPWAKVLTSSSSARFRVTAKKSRLYHTGAIAQRLADAVVRALPGVRIEELGERTKDDTDLEVSEPLSSQLFVVRAHRDQFTVSADASGELLHRRGYRQQTAKAPLRETLAAALVAASGWDLMSPLVDPLCGSGTIPIEAALMTRGIAPGAVAASVRRFSVESWPGVSRAIGEELRGELAGATRLTGASVIGSDRDVGAIEAAAANAARAGVASDVELAVRAISAAQFPGERGWVVTNPPYGVRVGDIGRVRDLWAQLGHVLRSRAPGWRVGILSPDAALERQLQIPLRVAAQTTNGGIAVRLVVGEVGGGG